MPCLESRTALWALAYLSGFSSYPRRGTGLLPCANGLIFAHHDPVFAHVYLAFGQGGGAGCTRTPVLGRAHTEQLAQVRRDTDFSAPSRWDCQWGPGSRHRPQHWRRDVLSASGLLRLSLPLAPSGLRGGPLLTQDTVSLSHPPTFCTTPLSVVPLFSTLDFSDLGITSVSDRIGLIILLLRADSGVSDLIPHSVWSEHAWPCAHTRVLCWFLAFPPREGHWVLQGSTPAVYVVHCGPQPTQEGPRRLSALLLPPPWRAVTVLSSFISNLSLDTIPILSRCFQLPLSGDSTDTLSLWLLRNNMSATSPAETLPWALTTFSFCAPLPGWGTKVLFTCWLLAGLPGVQSHRGSPAAAESEWQRSCHSGTQPGCLE